ncbi:Acetylornithine deacetylase [Novipirellula aureliae]|uniref:Acetylornithine deacetylase n=2 Tax=Novipirellula aureliae TaxID=2527966 RepID=A0A5C6E8R6_9BACT|nr:Acetylornithine deacetylase [Novipirellula aureliae]
MIGYKAAEILKPLIAYPSVSSTSNAAISDHLASLLQSLRFDVELTTYVDNRGVQKVNVVAHRAAERQLGPMEEPQAGGIVYCCHTDVVPAQRWTGPGGDPFVAVIEEGRLYGRGSCDMKGSIAAFLAAVQQVSQTKQTRPLWIIATADEETGFGGAKHVVAESEMYRQIVAGQPLAIIGEPTLLNVVHAHKGIVGFRIRSHGRAAHSSRGDGVNANVAMIPMLNKIAELHRRTLEDKRYHDERFDPPTLSWNFGFTDHDTALNVTAALSEAWVSFRMMPEIDGEDLIAEARQFAEVLNLEFHRVDGGPPLWMPADSKSVRSMCELAATEPITECYSTDGGQFTQLDQRLVIGPGDIAQAHTSDESIALDQLDRGTEFYRQAIERWCV